MKDVQRIAVTSATGFVGGHLAKALIVAGHEVVPISRSRVGIEDVGKRPLFVPLPMWVHRILARVWECTMRVPLVSRAQVQILSEGIVKPLPFAEVLPSELTPRTPFGDAQIRRGLPEAKSFGWKDCRCAWPGNHCTFGVP